jgi:hypothetical protein
MRSASPPDFSSLLTSFEKECHDEHCRCSDARRGVVVLEQPRRQSASPASIAADNSLLAIDRELDSLLDRMQEELEENGESSPESMDRFQQFCEAFGEKVIASAASFA